MTWWMWVLLVLLSLLVLGLLGWRLFQQVRVLLREVSAVSRRTAEVQADARRSLQAWRAARAEADADLLAGLEKVVR